MEYFLGSDFSVWKGGLKSFLYVKNFKYLLLTSKTNLNGYKTLTNWSNINYFTTIPWKKNTNI